MAVTAGASNMKRPEIGYENMSHFVVDTDDLADTLRNIQFCSGMQVWNDWKHPNQLDQYYFSKILDGDRNKFR